MNPGFEPSDVSPQPIRHRAAHPRQRWHLAAGGVVLSAVTIASMFAVTGLASAAPASTSAPAPATVPRCDDGPWSGPGSQVEGRPVGFDAGDAGRTYVWHDGDGWHLRTTDARPGPHHYSGTITASPGARLLDINKVRFEPADHLSVDDHNTVHYSFTTYQGIDGFDFRVSACDADRDHEILGFYLQKDDHNDNPAFIDLGAHRDHPSSNPFTVHRSTDRG